MRKSKVKSRPTVRTIRRCKLNTVKRVLAIVLLVVVVLAVGYLCYTGSRLAATQENTEAVYEQTI